MSLVIYKLGRISHRVFVDGYETNNSIENCTRAMASFQNHPCVKKIRPKEKY
jgi:hypothetical protein